MLPDIRLPKPEVEKTFTVEGTWDERPMGFHVPSSSDTLLRDPWEEPERRKKIFDYCPEIKMILKMKLERERCEEEKEEKNRDPEDKNKETDGTKSEEDGNNEN